jgi:DNA-binding MarR family transcriptional regulator
MQSTLLALKNLRLSWRREFHGMSQTETMVLLTLASTPGIESSAIQAELDLDQPHTSRVLNKLASKEFIRGLPIRQGERKKHYFLRADTGASRLLAWIDAVLDELLVRNPAMLSRLLAALEVAPEGVIECLEVGLQQAKHARLVTKRLPAGCYKRQLARRNQADHRYRRLFTS